MKRLALVVAVAACSHRAPVKNAAPPRPVAVAHDAPTTEPTILDAAAKQRDAARLPLATTVVDAFSNWPGSSSLVAAWSPDGKAILFASSRAAVPQIYAGDPARPGAAPALVTPGTERATWAAYTRDGASILFLRDTGADENFAIWRANRDGSGAVNLTPGAVMHREEPLLPRAKPGVMLYGAAQATAPDAHLYEQALDGGAPRLVYSQPLPGGAADVTPDGARVLFLEFHADDDIVVREVDVAAGTARQVFPPEGSKAGLGAAGYVGDGARLFVSTEQAGHSVLLLLDAKTGKEIARYTDAVPTASLSAVASPKGDLIAVGVDAGTHGELRVLDAKTLAHQRTIKAPLGEVTLGQWRPDGRAFSAAISLPNQPPDPFAVDAYTGAVSPLRADARPGLATLPPINASIETVRAHDGLLLSTDVYLPKRAAGQRLPVLAIFHGGPSASSAIGWSFTVRFFTALGYAVVEPNVRGSTGFGRDYEMADNREKRADWLRDVATMNVWIRAQPWADAERIVVMGGSYGGYTTLMALTRQPTAWRAGIDLVGPADLKSFLTTTDAAIRAGFVPEFGDIDADAALLEEFSPMRDVDRIVRPLFVYAGQNDPRVPRSESDAIVRALRTRHVPVEYMVAAQEGHSVDRRDTKLEFLTRAARFLEDALK